MKTNIFSYLFFLLGLFVGVTTIIIGIGPLEANVFTSMLAIIVLLKVFSSKKIYFIQNANEKYLVGFYLFGLLANAISILYQGSFWIKASINASIMTIIGVLGLLLVFPEDELKHWSKYFIKGLKINCVIQIIWGLAQYVFCELFHIALNYQLGLAHSRAVISPKYQVVGLGYERAQYCVILIVAIIILKNKYLKVLAALCIVMTQSRTGVIMLIITLIFMYSIKEWKELISLNPLKKIFFVSMLALAAYIWRDWIINFYYTVQDQFNDMEKDASAVKHMSYYSSFFDTINALNPIKTFFGYGTATSGYPYTLLYHTNNRGIAWNLESTWLANFWGYGILGFCCWLIWMLKNCVKYFKLNRQIFSLFLGLLIGGLGYQLMPNFIITTIVFLCISNLNKEDVLKKQNEQQENEIMGDSIKAPLKQ